MTDHTPEPDSVREAFERWLCADMNEHTANAWKARSTCHPNEYADRIADGMWDGYQAADAAAQSRIAALEAERDGAIERADFMLAATRDAQDVASFANDRWAEAQRDRDEALARVASLEQAMREVLEFQSAPEGPHISEWGRWRRLIDGSKWVERAGLSAASTANQAACRQQNAIHEPQAGLSLTGEPREVISPCQCRACLRERDEHIGEGAWRVPVEMARMILCATCGCKRCPHATDHRYACTDSNEPGQPGSAYGPPADRASKEQPAGAEGQTL